MRFTLFSYRHKVPYASDKPRQSAYKSIAIDFL
ncbi:MAG: hypothetical protein ACI9UQ_002424, partial [Candidatus Krumholzibacteriia bacterium]